MGAEYARERSTSMTQCVLFIIPYDKMTIKLQIVFFKVSKTVPVLDGEPGIFSFRPVNV